MQRLLAALGNPHLRLPRVIHVAGTNGKGSTVAFLRAILESWGRTVHVYTSPHLVRFNERIRIAGSPIDDPALAALLDRVETANAGQPITYFEITTAAAFLAFAECPADLLLLEVGLGGRLDATNVVDDPAVTAIATISMDHVQFLGDTLAAIAGEKAGIAKRAVPLVVAPQLPEAETAVRLRAEAVGARLCLYGRDWQIVHEPTRWRLLSGTGERVFADPPLPGWHQRINLAVAVLCLDHLLHGGIDGVDMQACAAGLGKVDWPARLQRLARGPLMAGVPQGWTLWLDGGHNDSAGVALADWAARRPDQRPLHLIVGMLESKDATAFLAPLAGVAASIGVIPIAGEPASFSADTLAAHARAAGHTTVAVHGDPAAALAAAAGRQGPADVLICGSLYLAGRILAQHG
ncbi:MAG: bifunctional folylpolyglutamate synthase/dihydrofolate synthase [Rhodospirillaceae bacterium]|nr:bifunctional folylpolyglutamate synthase/dihydrofolate synthase [Rhodospirillaceae bacterium]